MRQFLVLNEGEIAALRKQVKGQGGFQSLMRRLQGQYRPGTSELRIEDDDVEQIQHYAFDYEQGGWEDDLMAIFSRHLGPTLGRGGHGRNP
jgi:hypothetical protein